jgi:hypothetical protein
MQPTWESPLGAEPIEPDDVLSEYGYKSAADKDARLTAALLRHAGALGQPTRLDVTDFDASGRVAPRVAPTAPALGARRTVGGAVGGAGDGVGLAIAGVAGGALSGALLAGPVGALIGGFAGWLIARLS